VALATATIVLGTGTVGAPHAAGSTSSAVTGVGGLVVRVIPSTARVGVGDAVAFVAEITNTGGVELRGVRMAGDTADDGLSLLGARTDTGVFDPASVTWFVDSVAPGGSATLELFARANTTGTPGVVLLVATDEPERLVGTATASVEVVDPTGATAPTNLGFPAALLLTAGGALVMLAAVLYLRSRRPAPADAVR